MSPDASAFRALGLAPGAAPAAVEAAYRRLIKQYHPDREGGDPARAAEINWAYDHIRTAQRLPAVRRTSYPVVQQQRQPGATGRLAAVALATAFLILLVNFEGLRRSFDGMLAGIGTVLPRPDPYHGDSVARQFTADLSELPIDSDAIDRSVLSAVRLAAEADPERLASQSRRCHAELRRAPDLSRLDQCVAFDEAVIALIDSKTLDDRTDFSASAVTGRQLGAARLFTTDYIAIESRLDRIRTQVQFLLAPADPRPVPPIEI